MNKLALYLTVFSISFYGCGNQKLLQRYSELSKPNLNNDSSVTKGIEIYASARDIQVPTISNQYVLTDHGQAAYINALSALKPKDFDALQSNLFPDVSGAEKAPSNIDNTTFSKRLLFTVLNNSPYQADRITKLSIKVHLQPSNSNIKILTFDKIITEYQTVDLGSINLSNSLTLGASANYGITGKTTSSTIGNSSTTTTLNSDGSSVVSTNPLTTTGSELDPALVAGLSATYTHTYAEQANIKNRYIALTGYIKDDVLTFDEESISGVNLTGNIISDIKFKITTKSDIYTYNASGLITDSKPSTPEKVKIKAIPVYEAALPGELSLPVDYELTIRHVLNTKGQKTFAEGDDKVSFYTKKGSTSTNLMLENRDDLKVKKWFIAINTNTLNIVDTILGKSPGIMYFTSYDACVAFFRWLKKVLPQNSDDLIIGDYKLLPTSGTLKDLIKNGTVQLDY